MWRVLAKSWKKKHVLSWLLTCASNFSSSLHFKMPPTWKDKLLWVQLKNLALAFASELVSSLCMSDGFQRCSVFPRRASSSITLTHTHISVLSPNLVACGNLEILLTRRDCSYLVLEKLPLWRTHLHRTESCSAYSCACSIGNPVANGYTVAAAVLCLISWWVDISMFESVNARANSLARNLHAARRD